MPNGAVSTYSVWSWKVCTAWCVETSHSFTSLSSLPVATSEVSALKHAVRTQLLCPTREQRNFRDGRPQIYTQHTLQALLFARLLRSQ
jgi:hypothetical protein